MFTDILTIIRKELKEIMVQRGSLRSGITNILIVVAVTGILFPLQWGGEWLTNPLPLVSVAWLPLFLSMGLVADAFAGERERHTLETLLASRLSDQAILLGKMAAALLYGAGIAVASLLIGAVTVNLGNPGAGFYPAQNFLGALMFILLTGLLISSLGALVSLHASTVRQAYQRMSLGFILLWLPLILAPQLLPESAIAQIDQWFMQVNWQMVIIGIAAGLLALDLLLVALAMARFQRTRLILD